MSIPEQISGISLGSAYIRPGTVGAITSVTYIAGSWITVDTTGSLFTIDQTRTSTGQLAFVSQSQQFYIATKVPADFVTTFDDTVTWAPFTFSGSFSGSFSGDGSGLTGIASSLYLSGSTGSDTVNLKTDALTLTGSAQGIVVAVTDNKATFSISNTASITGSFKGDGSGLTGVAAAPAGSDKTVQFRSGSATAGAADFVYDHTTGYVGIGTVSPSAKLTVAGDVIVTGRVTAEEFHTEFVSASIIYQSGSTQFGNSADDNHVFTGTVNITGSVLAPRFSGSFSGSFQGDGSNLTGIASTLALSGSTGNDVINLKTEALTITGSAKNIDVSVASNAATVTVSNNLALSNVSLTGSFTGNFSGSVTAVITNAITASYVLNAVSASYVLNAISASYAATASSADDFRVRNTLIASGLTYPTADGAYEFQTLQTNAAGTLSFGDVNTIYETIRNGETTTIVAGTPVYVSGSQGATPIVYRADAADPAKMPVTYVVSEDIATNTTGRGIVLGLISGIDLTGYTTGQEVYVGIGGGWTVTRPTGSATVQLLGVVSKPGNGGKGLVLNPGPATLPNLTSGSAWVGNSSSYPVAVPTASFYVTQAASASLAANATLATTASYALTASHVNQLNQNVVISGNLTVFGTSSFTYTTSSQLAVADAFISVNIFEPVERFGGIKVYDSGAFSDLATASLAWDSLHNHWVYQNASGSTYTGGMLLSGPRNTGSLGEEPTLTKWFVPRSDGGDHLDNSQIFTSGSTTVVTGSLTVTQNVVAVSFTGSFTGSFAGSVANAVTASHALTALSASYALNATSASYLFLDAQYGENFTLSSPAANQVRLTRPSGTTSTATFTVATASHALTAVTASHATGYAKGTGQTGQVTIWKDNETVSGSTWLRVTSSIDGGGTPGLLLDGNYYSYAQTATGGNGFVAFSGSAATTASLMGVNVSATEGQLYSGDGGVVKSAIRLSTFYTDAYTIGRFLTPGTDNLLRIAPDVLILGNTTINGDLVVGGKVTAEEFHTEFVSASIIYRSGSTKFGDTSDDVHQFTGSVNISTQLYAGLDSEVLPNIVGYNTSTGELTYYASSSVRATPIPGGSDNQVQYNDNGTMAGASGFVWDGTNVGIGTASPGYKLEVAGTQRVSGNFYLYNTVTNVASNYADQRGLGFNATTGTVEIAANTVALELSRFSTTGAVLSIRHSGSFVSSLGTDGGAYFTGNVGIGTTNPNSLLTVYTAQGGSNISATHGITGTYPKASGISFGATSTSLSVSNNSGSLVFTGGAGIYANNVTASNNPTDLILWTTSGGTPAERVRILSDGNVGIGETSPSYKLHVVGQTAIQGAESDFWMINTGGGAGTWRILGSTGNTTKRFRIYDHDNGADRLNINANGSIRFNTYGLGTFTGTATKTLGVDSSGNVIELDVSSNGTGVANQVAFWKDTDTVSGSASLTWNGSTFYINGTLEATEKSFVIDHPILPGKKLVYGVLEGPEHAVYCRGKISGEVIQLPEEWTGLVDSESITVQLTPIGKHQNLYVVDIKDNKVFIKNGDLLTSKINAYYYIQATRKDIKPLTTVREA